MQSGLVSFYKAVDKFDPTKSKLTTWIYTITFNKAKNYLKRARQIKDSERIFLESETVELRLRASLDGFEVAHDRLETENVLSEEQLCIARAFSSLKEEDQSILVMRIHLNLSYEEIASVENTKASALRVRYNRARKRLRAAYEREKSKRETTDG